MKDDEPSQPSTSTSLLEVPDLSAVPSFLYRHIMELPFLLIGEMWQLLDHGYAEHPRYLRGVAGNRRERRATRGKHLLL